MSCLFQELFRNVTLSEQEHFMKDKINTMNIQQNQEALLNSGVT